MKKAVFLFCMAVLAAGMKCSAQTTADDSLNVYKLRMIEQMLRVNEKKSDTWWYGWLGGYSAATAVQAGIMISSDELKTRQDMGLGAATTFVGAIGQFFSPLYPDDRLKQWIRFPENSGEERGLKLAEAEELLKARAKAETEGRSLKMHLVCTSVNLCSGLITWLAFDRTVWAGVGNFALNSAITEFQIFSQPIRAKKDLEKYKQYAATGTSTASKYTVTFNMYPGKAVLLVKF